MLPLNLVPYRRAMIVVALLGASPGPSVAAGPPTESPRPAPIPVAAGGAVRVEMKNVNLHVTDRVVLMIHSLRGALLRTARSRPPDIPFKVKAELLPTPDGRIRVHARSIKAAGLPVKGLMGLLGIEMDDMVKIQAGRGIVVEDNDFILDPQQMLPPPHIRGNVSSVRIEGDQVIQVFGTGAAPGRRLCPYASYRNYMYFRGGNLRFGKLTMVDTDLALIDQDAKDPFDFNLDRYNDQLVAGYSKNTPSRGLKTFMPDADDLRARTAAVPASGRP